LFPALLDERAVEGARTRLHLLPGQPFETPAVLRVAVVGVIQVALEPVQYIVDVGETGTLERLARLDRAVAAATDQDDGPMCMVGPCHLLDLTDEMRVDLPVGPVIPGDVQRTGRMPDEQVLHLAAAIHEERLRRVVQEFERLTRREMLHSRGGKSGEVRSISCAAVARTALVDKGLGAK